MEIIVQEQGKLVTVWLNRKEQESNSNRFTPDMRRKNTRLRSITPAEKNYTTTPGICCSTIAASWQKRRYNGKSWQPCQEIPVANGTVPLYNGNKNSAKGCGSIDRDF